MQAVQGGCAAAAAAAASGGVACNLEALEVEGVAGAAVCLLLMLASSFPPPQVDVLARIVCSPQLAGSGTAP